MVSRNNYRQDDIEYQRFNQNLMDLLENWSPRTHCSNCMHCIVRTNSEGQMIAYCDKGYGSAKLLVQIIRPSFAQGWRDARKCPDFDDMDEAC